MSSENIGVDVDKMDVSNESNQEMKNRRGDREETYREETDGELQHKFNQRAGLKSVVTKIWNDMRFLMVDHKNAGVVEAKIPKLDQAWEKYEEKQSEIYEMIIDEEEILKALEYKRNQNHERSRMKDELEKWLECVRMQEAFDDIGDSASQVGSAVSTKSSISSVRQKRIEAEAARKALEVKYLHLERQQRLIERQFAIQKQREEDEAKVIAEQQLLETQLEIEQMRAKEQVYAEAEEETSVRSKSRTSPRTEDQNKKTSDKREDGKERSKKLDDKSEDEKRRDKKTSAETHNEEKRDKFVPPFNSTLWSDAGHESQRARDLSNASFLNVADKYFEQLTLQQQQQQQSMMSLTLPKPEVPVFCGDPTEYLTFIQAFDSLIEAKTTSNSSRLHFLVQYTAGDVKELMRSCLAMNPEAGYKEARLLLKKRFGQEYKIASAYVDKVTQGNAIKADDKSGLQTFSVQLTGCYNTLSNIGYTSKMENPDSLRAVVARLPFDARKRWRSVADRISEEEQREIKMTDIVKFVEREARTVSHPIFGDLSNGKDFADKQMKKSSPSKSRGKGSAYSTQSRSEDSASEKDLNSRNQASHNEDNRSDWKPRCLFCDQPHRIRDCPEFPKKPLREREDFAKRKGLCFNCLIPNHRSFDCRRPAACTACQEKHHTLLHPWKGAREEKDGKNNDQKAKGANGFIGAGSRQDKWGPGTKIGLPVLPVKVKANGSDRTIVTYAFLDSGSNCTLCSEDLLKQLGLEGVTLTFELTTLTSENSSQQSRVVSLEVLDLDENNWAELPRVFSTRKMPVIRDDIPSPDDLAKWPNLSGIQIPQLDASVGILIGNDNSHVMEPKEVRESKNRGPYAVRTLLGWVINGPLGRTQKTGRFSSNFVDVKLDSQFREFCNREFNDSISTATAEMSQDDIKAIKIMEKSIQLKEGHYELDLPFREKPSFPDNRPMAEHRLRLLKKRLQKDPELKDKYVESMMNLQTKGYAEEVPKEGPERVDGTLWYLPHHPVLNVNKPGKIRVVFDCSARHRETSLNDQLYQGPDLANTLVGVLTRFRQEPVALMADIEAMFNQVRVTPTQRDTLRFLWWPTHDIEQKPIEYRMKVHLFGATSSPSCCNFALKRTAIDNKEDFDADVIKAVTNSFYVDDCLVSVSSEESAIRLRKELKDLLTRGGFNLTKWVSNSQTVVESIPAEDRAAGVKELELSTSPVERALGVRWDVVTDTFKFKVNIKSRPPTRRGILSMMSSIYDPLGFVSPLLLPVKRILQDLCRQEVGWDDPIPDENLKLWNRWLTELPKLETFSIPRCVKPAPAEKITSCELHHFSDASDVGYGAVSYLRTVDDDNVVHCSFLMGKSRLAPMKTITIPRLELSAATLSVRLDKMIRKELELKIDKSVFWTDSTSVLKFIQNEDKRFQTFVANRIAQIHDGSDPKSWKYVNTKQNPADEASRGIPIDALCEPSRWSTGPGFLWQHKEEWPTDSEKILPLSPDHPEVKKKPIQVCCTIKDDEENRITDMISKTSSWHKLRCRMAWVLRFVNKLRHRRFQHDKQLKPEELREAEKTILEHVQKQEFPIEAKQLASTVGQVTKSSRLWKLDPMLKEGLIRVGGRLKNSSLPDDAKHQVVLSKNHHITRLIVEHYHKISGHSGRQYVLMLIRRKYWIIHGSGTVRRVLRRCLDCRRRQGNLGEQKMADLPNDRVADGKPPFSAVGVDYFGPIYVTRGRTQLKRYGCIFTCLAVRAVHIEVSHTMDTDSFLNALRRFISRRGRPELIRSDNGGNFVSGNKELRECIQRWNQQKINDFLLQQEIRWIFNPPAGSHHGGVWERCIRTVRKIMSALLKEQLLDDEGLCTLMCEIEAIINGRPLTSVSDDPRDLSALTPNHLLLLRSGDGPPLDRFVKTDLYVARRWRRVQYMADQFWKRFTREYLPLLQERSKWNKRRRNFAVGDLVILRDETTHRSMWPLARVQEVFPGRDGLVRRLKVKTRTSVLERPIDKCVLLEAVDDSQDL